MFTYLFLHRAIIALRLECMKEQISNLSIIDLKALLQPIFEDTAAQRPSPALLRLSCYHTFFRTIRFAVTAYRSRSSADL